MFKRQWYLRVPGEFVPYGHHDREEFLTICVLGMLYHLRERIGMQHVSFVMTPERFDEIERRLDEHGIDHTPRIPQLPGLLGIYFYDPNGIRLEMACQPEDGETPVVIDCVLQTKAQARAELETLDGVEDAWIERMVAALPDG